jgi:hypothetical protein
VPHGRTQQSPVGVPCRTGGLYSGRECNPRHHELDFRRRKRHRGCSARELLALLTINVEFRTGSKISIGPAVRSLIFVSTESTAGRRRPGPEPGSQGNWPRIKSGAAQPSGQAGESLPQSFPHQLARTDRILSLSVPQRFSVSFRLSRLWSSMTGPISIVVIWLSSTMTLPLITVVFAVCGAQKTTAATGS